MVSIARHRSHVPKYLLVAGAHLAYGTTYHIRVRAVDFSGNRSNFTSTVPFAYTFQDTPDIKANAITQWVWGGNAGPGGPMPADSCFYATVAKTINNVQPFSVVLCSFTMYVSNTGAAGMATCCLARTAGNSTAVGAGRQEFPHQSVTLATNGVNHFSYAVTDTEVNNVGSGLVNPQYVIDLLLPAGMTVTWYMGIVQLGEIRR